MKDGGWRMEEKVIKREKSCHCEDPEASGDEAK
jgi:hypothetical protein